MDTECTPAQLRAEVALEEYKERLKQDNPQDTVDMDHEDFFVDLLTDLRHLADTYEYDFEHEVKRSAIFHKHSSDED